MNSQYSAREKASSRLESLDWLRGLMALSIMLYHFMGHSDAARPLGRLGTYGVSIFFVLSGLSMAIAYDHYIRDTQSAIRFFVRRLFRIWPLLWVAVALVVIPTFIRGQGPYGQEPYSLQTVFLNLTTLFGFVAPADYINMGAWSIGNEMVYYALTPVLIGAYHWHKAAGNVVTLLSIFVGLMFAFMILDAERTLSAQWTTYINPFNNLFLYCAGVAIYYNLRDSSVPAKWHMPLFILPVVLFFLLPVSGDQIKLVTGVNRILFSLISLWLVVAFYKCAPSLPRLFARQLEQLGIATYGVYILHPIVLDFVQRAFNVLDIHIRYLPVVLSIGLSIALALLTYRLLEEPLIAIGKRLTTVPTKAQPEARTPA